MVDIDKGSKEIEKMLYIIANKTGSRREINKINNIKDKASKKRRTDGSDSSRDELDSN